MSRWSVAPTNQPGCNLVSSGDRISTCLTPGLKDLSSLWHDLYNNNKNVTGMLSPTKYKLKCNDSSEVMVSLEHRIPSKNHGAGKSHWATGNLGKPHDKCRNAHFTQWGGIVVKREVNTQMANQVPRCFLTGPEFTGGNVTAPAPSRKLSVPVPRNPVTPGWTVPGLSPQQDQVTAGAHSGMCRLLWFLCFLQPWAPGGLSTLLLPSLPSFMPSSFCSLSSKISFFSSLSHNISYSSTVSYAHYLQEAPGFPPSRGSGWSQNHLPTVVTNKTVELKPHDLLCPSYGTPL